MATLQKFLFDLSFDDVAAPPTAAAAVVLAPSPPPEPIFTAADLATARAEAFAEGQRAAVLEAEAATQRQLATALGALASRLPLLERRLDELMTANACAAVRVAMAVTRKLLPALTRRHGLGEVEALLTECVAQAAEEPRLTVRIHQSLRTALERRLAGILPEGGFEGRLLILDDARLAPGDCRIEWAEGGAERDQEELWRELEATVQRHLSHADVAVAAGDDTDPVPL